MSKNPDNAQKSLSCHVPMSYHPSPMGVENSKEQMMKRKKEKRKKMKREKREKRGKRERENKKQQM